MYDLDFCQDPERLLEYGVISRRGPRDNQTDCEADVVLIHIPSKTVKRFHGTFWEDKYVESLCDWVLQFPKSKKGITIDLLNYYYTCYIIDLLKE